MCIEFSFFLLFKSFIIEVSCYISCAAWPLQELGIFVDPRYKCWLLLEHILAECMSCLAELSRVSMIGASHLRIVRFPICFTLLEFFFLLLYCLAIDLFLYFSLGGYRVDRPHHILVELIKVSWSLFTSFISLECLFGNESRLEAACFGYILIILLLFKFCLNLILLNLLQTIMVKL